MGGTSQPTNGVKSKRRDSEPFAGDQWCGIKQIDGSVAVSDKRLREEALT